MLTWIMAWFGGLPLAVWLLIGSGVFFAIGALLKPRKSSHDSD